VTTMRTTRRPGVVTFIAVIVLIQAVIAAAVAITTFVLAGSERVQAETGLSLGGLVGTGIVEALVAVLLLIVGAGLLAGARGARLFVALVEGIRMVTAVVLIIVHLSGGYLFNGLITVIIGLFVLWALYVYQPSEDYFTAARR
jgi:hypothetical protein